MFDVSYTSKCSKLGEYPKKKLPSHTEEKWDSRRTLELRSYGWSLALPSVIPTHKLQSPSMNRYTENVSKNH